MHGPLAARVMQHLEQLAAAPRYMGTPGAHRALRYLEAAYGNLPGVQVSRETFSFPLYRPGPAQLFLDRRGPVSGEPLAYGMGAAQAPLVYVGTGGEPELESVMHRGRSLAGAIWVSDNLRSFAVGATAMEHGAAGLVLIGTVPGRLVRCGCVRLDRKPVTLPAMAVSQEDGAAVVELALEGGAARIEVGGEVVPAEGENLVASFPGHKPGPPVLVLAHYDSFWNGPHAMDNASGSALALALAEQLAARAEEDRPGRPIQFVATGAEELGLWGAEAYAREHRVTPASVAAVLSLDALGSVDSGLELSVTPALRIPAERALEAQGLRVDVWRTPPRRGSDHEPFAERGVPVGWLNNAGRDLYYHTAADRLERIDPDRLEYAGRIAAALLERLASAV